MGQGGCENRHFVLGWETQNLLSRRYPQTYINHWDAVYPKHDVPDAVHDDVAVHNSVDSCPQIELIPEMPCAESQPRCPPLDNKVPKTCKTKYIESLSRLTDLDFWTSMQEKLSKCTSYAEIK